MLVMLPIIASQFVELSGNVRGYLDNLVAMIKPAAAFIEEQTGHKSPVVDLEAQIRSFRISQMSPDRPTRAKEFNRLSGSRYSPPAWAVHGHPEQIWPATSHLHFLSAE